MNMIKKSFSNLEVINIVAFVNKVMTDEQKNALPTKFKWYLKKNMDKLAPIAAKFEEFRDGEVQTLQSKYFTEEKSEEIMETQKDENGEEHEVPMRKVKAEFMDDYTDDVSVLNSKLQEILMEQNEIEISSVDLDAFVESLSDDSPINFDCLSILSFMDESSNVINEEAE